MIFDYICDNDRISYDFMYAQSGFVEQTTMVALVSNRERMKINLLISVKNKKKLHDNEEMNKLYF